MSAFQFQFQYDPADLKAIRDASGTVVHSPSTTISIWAAGFAVALLILGANGMWDVLLALVVCAAVFGMFYVSSLRRKNFADREIRVRTLTLKDKSVSEEFGSSFFEKSWSAFDDVTETQEHFLFQHYEKVTALPKRVFVDGQLEPCRDFIEQRVHLGDKLRLERFDQMFAVTGAFPVYKFCWEPEDTKLLRSARMQRYGEHEAGLSESRSIVGRLIGMIVLWAGIAITFFLIGQIADFQRHLLQLVSFFLAIIIPFLVGYIWWRYTGYLARSRAPRIPADEIFVTLNETDLMIGYSQAVARYNWQDVAGFYFGKNFIGFQPVGGMVHVIANRAFGDLKSAREFLQLANQLKAEHSPLSIESNSLVNEVTETGNPYQAPASLD